jgi:hypothetical protein
MRKPAFIALLLFMALAPRAFSQTPAPPPPDTFPLDEVIAQVNLAFNDYQTFVDSPENQKVPAAKRLPHLKSAEFDFKTTIDTSVGPTFSFLVFTIGGTRSTENVNDVTFHYQVPPAVSEASEASFLHGKPPRLLREDLTKTIKAAAATLQNAPEVKNLPFQQLTITISYGVKWDVKAGVTVPMLVTTGFNFEKSRNAVQSVKLVYADK